MQGRFADTDRRIGVQRGDDETFGDLIGAHHPDPVPDTCCGRVRTAEVAGACVGFHRPDRAVRIAQPEGHRDRAVASSQVDQVPFWQL